MDKIERRNRRKKSIRKKIIGIPERPRMCVHKSNRTIYVQIIDDVEGRTLCGLSTGGLGTGEKMNAYTRKNMNFARALGDGIARAAAEKGIEKVVFDRSGYRYHGVVKALADAARKGGLQF